jgi:dihydroflavonol-4-reductase
MKVLVTGGAGFIGQHVVRRLVERGDNVRVALAPGEADRPIASLPVDRILCDIRDLPQVRGAVAGCDAVIHMAAIYALWMRDYRPMYQVNVQGTRNVLEAASDAGVRRIVHTSSIAALGIEGGGRPANEETRFNQHGRASHYVLSKFYAERVALELAGQGAPVVVVNPSFPFGNGDHRPTPTGRSIIRILEGTYFAVGPGGINVVDVEDVAAGHLLALDRGEPGRRYLLSGTDISLVDLFRTVRHIGGTARRPWVVPKLAMTTLGWFGDLVGRFTEPLLDSTTAEYTSQYLYYDCTRARSELGYAVTPLEAALRKAVDWFRSNGYFAADAPWRLAPWRRKKAPK